MELEITKIKKVNLVFEKIENLYTEISKIESLAFFASNNDFKGIFNLTLADSKGMPSHSADDDMTIHIDRIMPPNNWFSPNDRAMYGIPKYFLDSAVLTKPKKDKKHTLSNELSETATMQILGIILCEKQKNLKLLIDELEEMGFSLKEAKS